MMMVMMLMLLVLIVIMMMVMMLMLLVLIVIVMMVMMVMMLLIIHSGIIFEILHDVFHICGMLHGLKDLDTGNVIPRRGDHTRLRIQLLDPVCGIHQLLLRHILCPAEHYGSRCLDLIQEELTEVLHVNLSLGHIHYRCCGIQLQIHCLCRLLNGLNHIRKLADARGLDDDAIRMILIHYLLKSFTEVSHQGAADASGIQLIYLNPRILHEVSVHADLAELVLDQNQLLTGEGLLDQFLDKSCFSGSEEPGNDFYLCHVNASNLSLAFFYAIRFFVLRTRNEIVSPLTQTLLSR